MEYVKNKKGHCTPKIKRLHAERVQSFFLVAKEHHSTMSTHEISFAKTSAVLMASSLCAAIDTEGESLGLIQLFPLGEFAAMDGRPATLKHCTLTHWRLDAAAAQKIMQAYEGKKVQMVVDYEHQTQLAAENGQPAPAAGWIESLFVTDKGLFARVQWTERAKAFIRAGEYRYISPTFYFNPQSGMIEKLVCAALTNYPALDSLAPAKAKNTTEEDDMNQLLAQLRKLLQLDEKADMQACLKKVEELSKDNLPLKGVMALSFATLAAQENELALAKEQAVDTSKFVPMEQFVLLSGEITRLQGELEKVSSGQNMASLTAEIETAIKDGRLHAVSKPWALELAKNDPKALAQFLETAPKITALSALQSGGAAPHGANGADQKASLSAEDTYAMQQLGLSHDDFLKNKEGM